LQFVKNLSEDLNEFFLSLFTSPRFLECLDTLKNAFPNIKEVVTGVISKNGHLKTAIRLEAPGIVI